MQRRFLTLFCILLTALATAATAPRMFYVSPGGNGDRSALRAEDSAVYTDSGFWKEVQAALAIEPVTVLFAPGDYDRGALTLTSVGDPSNQLVLQGATRGSTILRLLANESGNPSTGLFLRKCENITINDLQFTGPGKAKYISQVNQSRHITFHQCTWIDLPEIEYGACGATDVQTTVSPSISTGTGTYDITFDRCEFKRVGSGSHAHMIYNAYRPRHITIRNSHFEDCSGDYVRFRDRTDFGAVVDCTFLSTGTYPAKKPVQAIFIAIPLFSDANPGNEWFGTNFYIAHNEFKRTAGAGAPATTPAIQFSHFGFDPPDRHHLMTADEGAVLLKGSVEEKKALLKRNCGLDLDRLHVFDNSLVGDYGLVAFSSAASYGAESKGWKGSAAISECVNSAPLDFADWRRADLEQLSSTGPK